MTFPNTGAADTCHRIGLSTRDFERPEDQPGWVEQSTHVRFVAGDTSDYSEAFSAALEQFETGDLDGALTAYDQILADHNGPLADADFPSVASAALNRASILSINADPQAAIAAFDSALQRFGADQRLSSVTCLAAAYAHGRTHRQALVHKLRRRRLTRPLAITLVASSAAATFVLKRQRK